MYQSSRGAIEERRLTDTFNWTLIVAGFTGCMMCFAPWVVRQGGFEDQRTGLSAIGGFTLALLPVTLAGAGALGFAARGSRPLALGAFAVSVFAAVIGVMAIGAILASAIVRNADTDRTSQIDAGGYALVCCLVALIVGSIEGLTKIVSEEHRLESSELYRQLRQLRQRVETRPTIAP